jgi:hypothetical protein
MPKTILTEVSPPKMLSIIIQKILLLIRATLNKGVLEIAKLITTIKL